MGEVRDYMCRCSERLRAKLEELKATNGFVCHRFYVCLFYQSQVYLQQMKKKAKAEGKLVTLKLC